MCPFNFEPLLGWECAYVCHNQRTEKEGILDKRTEYETIGIQVTFILEIKLQVYIFKAKYDHFSAGNASFLNQC